MLFSNKVISSTLNRVVGFFLFCFFCTFCKITCIVCCRHSGFLNLISRIQSVAVQSLESVQSDPTKPSQVSEMSSPPALPLEWLPGWESPHSGANDRRPKPEANYSWIIADRVATGSVRPPVLYFSLVINEFIHEAKYSTNLLCFSFIHRAGVSPPCIHPHVAVVVRMSLFSYLKMNKHGGRWDVSFKGNGYKALWHYLCLRVQYAAGPGDIRQRDLSLYSFPLSHLWNRTTKKLNPSDLKENSWQHNQVSKCASL